jgi:predicted acylesterase/phospholipase RssA
VGQLQGVIGKASLGDRQMDLLGISGTSAGAIIAALTWVGYSPLAIRDTIVKVFSKGERDAFFGPLDPSEVSSLSALLTYLKRAEAVLDGSGWSNGGWGWLKKWTTRAMLGISVFFLHGWAWKNKGILGGDGFENTIDGLLRASPTLEGRFDHITGHLKFDDLRDIEGLDMIPLFLMTTDVERRKLVTISSIDDGCGQFPIARAVRASAGFPIFFRPIQLGDHLACIDGGVIANAPSWVFASAFREQLRRAGRLGNTSAARLASAPWHHVALRLPDDKNLPPVANGFDFLKALWSLLSGIGRRTLEETIFTLVSNKAFIVVPPLAPDGEGPNGVLDFDSLADAEVVKKSFHRGREAARAAIDTRRFDVADPASIGAILVDLVLLATEVLYPYLSSEPPIRANIFLPVSATHMRIAYAANMENHRDVLLEVGARRSVTSICFELGIPLLANLSTKQLEPQTSIDGGQPFAPVIDEHYTWLMSVPILDTVDLQPRMKKYREGSALELDFDGPIFGVLNIDAPVIYGADGIDEDPRLQTSHPAVRGVFDAMKVAAIRVGMLMNRTWLEE